MAEKTEEKPETFAETLARDAVDGILRRAGKQGQQDAQEGEVTLDPETQKKIIEREVKMAADPDFALAEEAKLSAADRMRRSRERPAETRQEKAAPEKDKAAINKEIGATAKAMLDMGIPPSVVAQYLVGSSTPQVPIAFAGGGNQGLTLIDVLTLVDRMNDRKPNSELENIIKEMRDEIKALKNQPRADGERVDPVKTQASQLEGLTSLVESLVKLGVVQRPSTGAAIAGKPIEVVKEENRHVEKMEELKTESNYKTSVAETLAGIPEKIGQGIAAQMGEGKKSSSFASSELEHLLCTTEGCGFNIPYPPEAVQVVCPKCGATYGRQEKK